MRVRYGVLAAMLIAACSSSGGAEEVTVPDGATFCSVYSGEYKAALTNAVPITDDTFDERSAEIVAWAEVLADLAPENIADLAADNVSYHRAQQEGRSASAFIPGSNSLHEYAASNC